MKPLDFEQPIVDLEHRIAELERQCNDGDPQARDRRADLERQRCEKTAAIYSHLQPWQKVQIARHPQRLHLDDVIRELLNDFVELHGDRRFGDDTAIVGGPARFEGRPVMIIGHQKGRDTRENVARNFGMAHPEGYRKAARLMRLAEKFHLPVLCFPDTPGASPVMEDEERGQAEAIASNLLLMMSLRVPIVVVILGEGGSGGALAIGVGDRVLMLEHAVYSVASPEGCAAIVWRDSSLAPEAAEAMRVTAQELKRLGLIDGIVPEPLGGAQRDYVGACTNLAAALRGQISDLVERPVDALLADRRKKYRWIGQPAGSEQSEPELLPKLMKPV